MSEQQLYNEAVQLHETITALTKQLSNLCDQMGTTMPDFIQQVAITKYNQQQEVVATKPVEPKPTKSSRVKRSKTVDKTVEAVKGKRDVNKGDATKIDATKDAAMQHKPLKVEQEKRSSAKPAAEKANKGKQPARKHEGMSYAELRSNVSQRKAALNKADQERFAKAGCRNNTWEGAIASYNWLNQYFPVRELVAAA